MNKSRISGAVHMRTTVHSMPVNSMLLLASLLVAAAFQSAHASLITTYYGDEDGFGVGVTSGLMDPFTSNQDPGEAPLTDAKLISSALLGQGAGCTATECGPFIPGGSFDPFVLDGPIISAVLTLRTGSFDSSPPLDGTNVIYLDGMLVDASFIDGFSTANTNLVETRSISLNASFFPLLLDGSVSLAGTHISEASGSQQFQVDFLRLDITTAAVPVPAAVWLFGSGLLGLVGLARRKYTA